MSEPGRLSFGAVVGQETAKRALLLAAAEPRLGGVLLRGDKGSAKTTLARGLAALLPGEAPFVELPLGAGEDRVIGSIDVARLLADGTPAFRSGLLAAAHGGVLYVDEINLLADHLVDALLDAAASGVNRVERDGISRQHPARFVLVASMNPEEGELRPQLLDRFGLAVDITTSTDPGERATAVRRQLAAERTGRTSADADAADEACRRMLTTAVRLAPMLPDEVVDVASRLAVAVGAEGLRADLMLCRGATAAAALDGAAEVTTDHVRSVADMVLGHRRRRRPFDEPGIEPDELEQAWQQSTRSDDSSRDAPDTGGRPEGGHSDDTGGRDHPAPRPPDTDGPDPGLADTGDPDTDDPETGAGHDDRDRPDRQRHVVLPIGELGANAAGGTSGRFSTGRSARGRSIRSREYDGASGVDAHATALAVARRRVDDPGADGAVRSGDLRSAERQQRQGSLVVFALDTSASMGIERRMAVTKAAILGMLTDAYRRRGTVALVAFHHDTAEVVLRPTASTEIAAARLADIPTGGTTPLGAGLHTAATLVERSGSSGLHTHVVVVTDGRATHGDGDPTAAARLAGERLMRAATSVVVIDTESDYIRLGLARQLAVDIGAGYVHLDELDGNELDRGRLHGGGVEAAVRRLADLP